MASTPTTASTIGARPTGRAAERHRHDATSTPAGAAVRIDGVNVTYASSSRSGTVEAVRNATLHVEAGTIMALLGPSGCGKTSLLRAIAGLERPTAGSITIGDRTVSDTTTWVHPEQRSVGMVFQDGALFPHLSVADNVAFGLRSASSKLSKRDRVARVAEMLDLVDLADYGDRLPGTLSGGQQQRIALARSLAPQPSVLLLDEPFSALDAALRLQVRADVADIVRSVGVTTVFVTHDQDEAFVLGDRVAVLRAGHIEQVGTPDELYRHPHTRWVAGFVGEANLVRGRLRPDGTVDTLLGRVPVGTGAVRADRDARPEPSVRDDGRDDGRDDDGIAVEVSRDGSPVDVLVRPEQVDLRPGDCALVTNVEYYGHDVRYELELDDGSILAARTKSGDLHQRGDRLCVRFEGSPTEAWSADGGTVEGASTLLTP